MENYIRQINDYLPIDFNDEENNIYRRYIMDAYIENLENKKYQFALLAFHLMFMSFVFKEFWGLKEFDYQKVKRFCDNNKQLSEVCKMFDMSILPEKVAIDNAMNALGFHVNHRSAVQNFVDARDKCAHASGIIQYTESDIQYHMIKALDYAGRIQDKTKQHIQSQFMIGVKEYWDGDNKYKLSVDFAEELMKRLKLSPKEIEQLFEIDKTLLLSGVPKESKLSTEISYYMILSVLQSQYIENTSDYALIVPVDWLFINLRDFWRKLSDVEKTSIEVELEDELNASKERYSTVSFSILTSTLVENR
ncbi:MAG TPA: hypothetical protein VHY08_11215 [Bacillota bacterium]|nr:hypothetical protein [Bacillota bacterium]